MDSIWNLLVLPLGLGLLGFVEPCSIGSSLLFIRYVEDKPESVRAMQAAVFMVTRGLFIGGLGALAAIIGTAFAGFQQAGWLLLGSIYIGLGLLYLSGNAGRVMRTVGPGMERLSGTGGAVALAVLFGLNIPACAAPLLAALLAPAALGTSNVLEGFIMLAVFGLALSLPLVLALIWEPARRVLDRLNILSRRVPTVLGLLFVALGVWSIYLALFVPAGLQGSIP